MFFRSKAWLGAGAAMLLAGTAWAGETGDAEAVDFGSPVAEEALAAHRGGSATAQTATQVVGVEQERNLALGVVSGANRIADGSIRDNSGLVTVMQISGNNNSALVATNISLIMQ